MRYFRICSGLLTLAALGCGSGTTEVDNGLVSSVQLDRSEFQAGDSVKVTVTYENHGTDTTKVNTNACPWVFVVTTPEGKEVGPDTSNKDCFLMMRLEPLAPGAQISFSDYWNGSAVPEDGTAVMVAPGQYLIRGRMAGVFVPHRDSTLVRVL